MVFTMAQESNGGAYDVHPALCSDQLEWLHSGGEPNQQFFLTMNGVKDGKKWINENLQ